MTKILMGLAIGAMLQADPGHVQAPYHGTLEGTWSQYGKSPTDGQIWYHTEVTGKLLLPERYEGFIAVLDCARVGQEAMAWVGEQGPFYVFVYDCAGRADGTREWMRSNRIIGELDYYLLRELDVPVGRGVRGKLAWLQPRRSIREQQSDVSESDENPPQIRHQAFPPERCPVPR